MSRDSTSMSDKRVVIKRVLGYCLMGVSAVGLLISVLGLGLVFRFSGAVVASAEDALDVTVASLTFTQQNLDLAHRALGEAEVALGASVAFIEGASGGMESTSDLMESLSKVLAGDLPDVILETRRSLAAAEEGAAVIEEVLYGLDAISGLTGLTYAPDVPLTESFARISESLETIPETLSELDESLKATQGNLDDLLTPVADLIGPLEESQAVLAESRASVETYSDVIENLTLKVSSLQATFPTWLRAAVFSLYFLLIWLAVSQIGLLWQGWEMVTDHPGRLEDRVAELERKIGQLTKQRRK